ncbi:DUF1015 domain-containing protein [Ideonella sp. A 288]|uniref:DUF1015 domain-containing protein n=1 Tax=Ideonella sp. A 288 TaxID=1962181 RepID=UPI000B4B5AB7|nr:DUF1015 domain-containing protein [Ideonella sp. A 288]
MSPHTAFRLPRICLPRPGTDLGRWAVIACDQYTSEPEYWQQVEQIVGDAPSTLRLTFPEAYLDAADAPARITGIQAAMRRYVDDGLLVERPGTVLVERTVDGRTRRGLMLELDLEHYDYAATSTSLIRPTEGTIVARLAPRIAVRAGAPLELPHVLVLIDDPQGTVVEPVAAARGRLERLYQTELMLGGGQVSGYAVDDALGERAAQALDALARPEVSALRYGVPPDTPVMLFAVGDGNHSLATAKSIWERTKAEVGMDHPSRWALVEVENIHDPALHFAPIHRLLLGVTTDVRAALARHFGHRLSVTDVADAAAMQAGLGAQASGQAGEAAGAQGVGANPSQAFGTNPSQAFGTNPSQAFGLVGPGDRFSVVRVTDPPSSLAVGTVQAFIDALVAQGGIGAVDYVHGDDVLARLGRQPGCVGFHLDTVGKSELLRRVMHEGPLPRKTFSMGEAHEKRYYIEARRIR